MVHKAKNRSELAEILYDGDNSDDEDVSPDSGILQAEMESGLSKSEVFTFDNYLISKVNK